MKTMRKEDMDKAAWSWADNTEPKSVSQEHVELAYRIKLNVCKPNSCRRNCRGNPRCLSGMGESKWLGPKAAAAAVNVNLFDPTEERREKGSFVGLKNLGATCYVNSLLQLWFHNLKFRRAIYSWCPEEDPQERTNETLYTNDGKEYSPKSPVGHLQLLFALLHFGHRRYVDPTEFIRSLGLDTSMQQDAQEFSKLFFSMLEGRLSHQSSPQVKNIINEQFCGKYSYVTKCQQCGTESARPSLFYELELNIAGHKTLADCLAEYLQEEKLEGADRYHCAVCMMKQDATRSIKLDTLPPVLNLQLMRFVFDRQKSCKKKLNSYLQFPENLDMSMYVDEPPGSLLYALSAVLIHRGHSAYSGHYVAHICDSTTSTWYKFNDEAVERMEGKKLKLGTEEDINDGNKKNKPPKITKGFLTSNNAYMLVYTQARQADESNTEENKELEWVLPEKLNQLVIVEDRKFENWIKEMNETKAVTIESGKAHQEEMVNLYTMLPVNDGDPCDFIASDWLVKWLSGNTVKPVDNNGIICMHGKMDPNAVPQAKCINSVGADVLYEKYKGGPRLRVNASMCLPCVKHKCKVIRLKTKTTEDNKRLTTLLKAKLDYSSEPTYWVGKNSLRCWRRLVVKEMEGVKSEDDDDGETEGHSNFGCEVMSCDSIPNIDMDNRSEKEVLQVESNRNASSNDLMDAVLTSNIGFNSERSESVGQRVTRSSSKISIRSNTKQNDVDHSDSQSLKQSPKFSRKNSRNDSPVSSSTSRKVCDSKNANTKYEDMETEVSSSVSTEAEVVDLNLCNDSVVTSSDEVLGDRMLESEKEKPQSEVNNVEGTNQGVDILKEGFQNNSGNIVLNGISKICAASTVRPSQTKFLVIKTPGFGDDIIQNINEIPICIQSKPKTLELQDICSENQNTASQKEEEKVVLGVSSSVDERDKPDDDAMCNGEQGDSVMPDNQKQDDNDDEQGEEEGGFNEDILCPHGNLCAEEGQRRLVSKQVWDILIGYFPSARPFPEDESPCNLCQGLALEGKAARDMYRLNAAMQKESLQDLYLDKNRISLDKNTGSPQRHKQRTEQLLYLVSRDFIDSWRKFLRDPMRKDPQSSIVNENLLCPHGGLLCDLVNPDNSRFVLVTQAEWTTLCDHYSTDHEISVRWDKESNTLISEPGMCVECVMARMKLQEMELLQYEKAKIFVRKVSATNSKNGQLQDSGNSAQSSQIEYKDDPEYQGSDAKRPKLAPGVCSSPTSAGSSGSSDTRLRKSTRHRRVRGEKEFNVSSKLKLLEFKLMIMKNFDVAPFDQHLSIDGRDLEDNEATLGSLQVYPDSIILLKADEPSDETHLIEEYMKDAVFEEGFKGTELLK